MGKSNLTGNKNRSGLLCNIDELNYGSANIQLHIIVVLCYFIM